MGIIKTTAYYQTHTINCIITNKMPRTNLPTATRAHVRRGYRHRPGTVALREIRRQQRNTNLLIPKLSFTRVVKEIAQDFSYRGIQFSSEAIEALQTSTEAAIINLFSDLNLFAIHAGRQTVMKKDFDLYFKLNNELESEARKRQNEESTDSME